ncbi:MAG: hypothetical protein KIS85_06685 [Anaerolineales bacterium]|nr:hypothetical protein [Anaerolineales bacterium]
MLSPEQRLEILNRLERGELSTEEAAELLSGAQPSRKAAASPMEVLEQLERGEIDPGQAAERLGAASIASGRAEAEAEPTPLRAEVVNSTRRRTLWIGAIALGSLLAVLGGMWMRADLEDGSLGLAFVCAWAPLLLGVLLIVLGWVSRQGPWASVHLRSRKGSRHSRGIVDLDLPMPIGLTSQILKYTGRRASVSGIDLADMDDVLQALDEARKRGEVITIHANDDEGDVVDIQIS